MANSRKPPVFVDNEFSTAADPIRPDRRCTPAYAQATVDFLSSPYGPSAEDVVNRGAKVSGRGAQIVRGHEIIELYKLNDFDDVQMQNVADFYRDLDAEARVKFTRDMMAMTEQPGGIKYLDKVKTLHMATVDDLLATFETKFGCDGVGSVPNFMYGSESEARKSVGSNKSIRRRRGGKLR